MLCLNLELKYEVIKSLNRELAYIRGYITSLNEELVHKVLPSLNQKLVYEMVHRPTV